MPLKIPLGMSDFKTIIDEGFYYIDKTLFIEELHLANGLVIAINRPRRFGKTLNLSMLKYFYEISSESTAYLFENTAIWKNDRMRKLQGTYPVIFLTFKDCKNTTWSDMYDKMQNVLVKEFRRHYEELADSLAEHDHEDYRAIMNREASRTVYKIALSFSRDY